MVDQHGVVEQISVELPRGYITKATISRDRHGIRTCKLSIETELEPHALSAIYELLQVPVSVELVSLQAAMELGPSENGTSEQEM